MPTGFFIRNGRCAGQHGQWPFSPSVESHESHRASSTTTRPHHRTSRTPHPRIAYEFHRPAPSQIQDASACYGGAYDDRSSRNSCSPWPGPIGATSVRPQERKGRVLLVLAYVVESSALTSALRADFPRPSSKNVTHRLCADAGGHTMPSFIRNTGEGVYCNSFPHH